MRGRVDCTYDRPLAIGGGITRFNESLYFFDSVICECLSSFFDVCAYTASDAPMHTTDHIDIINCPGACQTQPRIHR